MILDPLKLESYDYFLPKELIALSPTMPKEDGKLLVYDRREESITHAKFGEFFDFTDRKMALVFNDTKVIKARLFGKKLSGGKIEIFIHKVGSPCIAQIKGKTKLQDRVILESGYECTIGVSLDGIGLREVFFFKDSTPLLSQEIHSMLELIGITPLPPYIKRDVHASDELDYQSVFSRHAGSVAAPTASLHFSEEMRELALKRHECLFLSLHIGAGTFTNMSSENILDHKIHSERLNISPLDSKKLLSYNHILCIGTTALRSVEFLHKLSLKESLDSGYSGECDIFLNVKNPPIKARALLTNFHLPKSSLLALVASMIGLERTLEIYKIAIEKDYKFYSYGDCMLIL